MSVHGAMTLVVDVTCYARRRCLSPPPLLGPVLARASWAGPSSCCRGAPRHQHEPRAGRKPGGTSCGRAAACRRGVVDLGQAQRAQSKLVVGSTQDMGSCVFRCECRCLMYDTPPTPYDPLPPTHHCGQSRPTRGSCSASTTHHSLQVRHTHASLAAAAAPLLSRRGRGRLVVRQLGLVVRARARARASC